MNDINLEQYFADNNQTKSTTNTIQNEISLEDISDGFERENRRYIHTLEL